MLGPLEVTDGGRAVQVGGARLRALLVRLALSPGETVGAEQLVDDLWEESPPAAAQNALQSLVSRLRTAVGRDRIESTATGYRLIDVEVDAAIFTDLVSGAHYREALALWRGPALADVTAARFATAPIARLEELRLTAQEGRIEADLQSGASADLVVELEALTAAHPTRERLRGQLMRALATAGRQTEALTVYDDTRQLLADRLGVDPSPELQKVHLAVLRGETAAATPASRGSRVPASRTSFIGREDELRHVAEQLMNTRLVTLTGPGGAGKTRLATEAAAAREDRVPDGAWFVQLASVTEPMDVVPAILTALGLREAALAVSWRRLNLDEADLQPTDQVDRLADVLASRRLLLVLDNCEHLIDQIARVAEVVLAAAPGVHILATSREALQLPGESVYPVPPLSLPDEGASLDSAGESAAVELFVDRGSAANPAFRLAADNLATVVRICRALDGIPLALELAAARLRTHTPSQIADRLNDRFALLTVGNRAALPRHQTLRAVIDWSWELLDAEEQQVLRRLAVCAGGATIDTAEVLCDVADVATVLAELVEKSLVMSSYDDEIRYRLLETVRVYGLEKLDAAGESATVRRAHAAHFLAFAEAAEPKLRTHDQLTYLDRLTADHDNIIAALRWAVDSQDVATALRLCTSQLWYWAVRGMGAEATEWAATVSALAGDRAPDGLEFPYLACRAVAAMATKELDQGIVSVVRGYVDRALEVTSGQEHPGLIAADVIVTMFERGMDGMESALLRWWEHEDRWVRAMLRVARGHLDLNRGRLEPAGKLFDDSLERFRQVGDRWGVMVSLFGRYELYDATGEHERALEVADEAHGFSRRIGDSQEPWMQLARIGSTRGKLGQLEQGRADINAALAEADRSGNREAAAYTYVIAGEFEHRAGDLDLAHDRYSKALDLAGEVPAASDDWPVGRGHLQAIGMSRLGMVLELRGELASARELHERALVVAAGTEDGPIMSRCVDGAASLLVAEGSFRQAAEMLGAAHTLRGAPSIDSIVSPRVRDRIVAAIGEAAFTAAYEGGRELSREKAFELPTPTGDTAR